MKLIIQIPCFNEEETLPTTYADLPEQIEGIDEIETLVIDDGSTDGTCEVASNLGVNHIVSLKHNQGLARAFAAGIERCLELGADIIVNTDADNQYRGEDIQKLVGPIARGEADVVVGDRPIDEISHFSWTKKKLHRWGSGVIRKLLGIEVNDVVSGFRAYSKEAAIRINILTEFSYTVENLIQLRYLKLRIKSVPIRVNERLRESRLFSSIPGFLSSQLATLLRVYTTYKALKVFLVLGVLTMLPGLVGFLRFLYLFASTGSGAGHIQSLVFSVVFVNIGFLVIMFGLLADQVSANRKLIERILHRLKKKELDEK